MLDSVDNPPSLHKSLVKLIDLLFKYFSDNDEKVKYKCG